MTTDNIHGMNTKYKEELMDKLRKNGLSNSSINMYVRNMEKLNDDEPLHNLNFLKKKDDIEKFLQNYKDNTKRNYYISISSILNNVKDESAQLNKLYKYYYEKMMDFNKMLKSEENKNEMNEKQGENWMPWSDVLEKYDELEDSINEFVNKKTITKKQYNTLLDYVVLSLYVLQPPRRNEYINMMVVRKMDDDMDDEKNYIVLEKKEFVFNAFKTAKKEGTVKIDINDKLIKALTNYLKHQPLMMEAKMEDKNTNYDVPFLVKFDGKPLKSVNAITLILNKIFGKKMGSSALRHMYLSDKYGDELTEKQKDAKLMSHSVGTQAIYIKKDAPK
jgi:integrase